MRVLFALVASIVMFRAAAQTHLPVPAYPYRAAQPLWLSSPYLFNPGLPFPYSPAFVPFDNSTRRLQWHPYAGLSTGFAWLNGGMSWWSAPFGVYLVRPLNNNLAAFGNLSVAPTMFSMSGLYTSPVPSSPYGFGTLGLSSRVEGGLIYTNDAKTFSISGSVSVERDSYPIYPPVPAAAKNRRQY